MRPQGIYDMGEERKEDIPFELMFKGKLLPASPNYPAGSVKYYSAHTSCWNTLLSDMQNTLNPSNKMHTQPTFAQAGTFSSLAKPITKEKWHSYSEGN